VEEEEVDTQVGNGRQKGGGLLYEAKAWARGEGHSSGKEGLRELWLKKGNNEQEG